MSTICKLETDRKGTILSRCKDKIWLGSESSIQVRNESTGDLIHELNNICVFNLCTLNDQIWAVSNEAVLVFNNHVCCFCFVFLFFWILLF